MSILCYHISIARVQRYKRETIQYQRKFFFFGKKQSIKNRFQEFVKSQISTEPIKVNCGIVVIILLYSPLRLLTLSNTTKIKKNQKF